MKKLLEHFFARIADVPNVSVEKIDKDMYVCYSENLKGYGNQMRALKTILSAYSLNNVVRYDEYNDIPAIYIDFGSNMHEKIEEHSRKFLVNKQDIWKERRLDEYSNYLYQAGLWDKRHKLASNFLVGVSFDKSLPMAYQVTAEATPGEDVILTFSDAKTPTVIYVASNDFRIVRNSMHTYGFEKVAKALIPVFTTQKDNLVTFDINAKTGSIAINDVEYTMDQINQILKPSKVVVATARKAHYEALREVLTISIQGSNVLSSNL